MAQSLQTIRIFIEKVKILRNHGIERNRSIQKNKGLWFYKMSHLGFNYRLSDINCSLGNSQLKSVNKFIKRRRLIAKKYKFLLKDIKNIILPSEKKGFLSLIPLISNKNQF